MTDAEDLQSGDAFTASGGICLPIDVEAGEDYYGLFLSGVRPLRDSLPPFTASRGGFRYDTPPPGGWGPAPAPSLKVRLLRRLRSRRSVLAARLHGLARWIGDEPAPDGWEEW